MTQTTHFRTCPLCEAMCGLEIRVDRRAGRPDPRRPRRRVEQGLPLPEGHRRSATSTTTPTACARRWSATATSGARSTGTRRSRAATSCSAGVIETHGIEAVTCYIGNPTAHNFSLSRYVGAPHRARRASR